MEKISLKILGNRADFQEYSLEHLLEKLITRYNTVKEVNRGDNELNPVFPVKALRYEGNTFRDEMIKWAKEHDVLYDLDPDGNLWLAFQGEEWRHAVARLMNHFKKIQFPSVSETSDRFILKYKDRTLNLLSGPKLMGIVNVTPDSFSDGGLYFDPEKAIRHIRELIEEGADIIDIGAESSRPGSPRISEEEEWKRLKPVLEGISEEKLDRQVWISLDTYKASVAEKALKYGVHIINDISAGNMDPKMMDVVSEAGCPYIMMHMKGTPESMQKNPSYTHVMDEIIRYFEEKIEKAQSGGINQIIIDPGIGFGKRIEDNYEIIRRLEEFSQLGYPVLLGASRKSFLWKMLKIEPKQADDSTMIINFLGIQNSAHILRVHNIRKHKEMLTVYNWVRQLKASGEEA